MTLCTRFKCHQFEETRFDVPTYFGAEGFLGQPVFDPETGAM
jgi:hypothetical protein